MQFLKIHSTFAAAVILSSGILSSGSTALAGELFDNQSQSVRTETGIGSRKIYQSTHADQLLDRKKNGGPPASFSQSSPYEYRIAAYDKAVDKYNSDYAKWQQRVLQIENQAQLKEQKDKVAEATRAAKLRDRQQRVAAKEEERLARLKARDERSKSSGGLFSRAFGGSSTSSTDNNAPAPVIQDEKAKKAESFFGNVEDSSPAVSPSASANAAAPQQKLSFWQRLKKAMFGG